jgi:protein-disulfide isomerase-like protein with CxxC motif
MPTTQASGQELGEEYIERLRQLPGFRLDSGVPCLCSIEAITTSKRRGYSDSLIFTHRCSECGNEFTTFIEG